MASHKSALKRARQNVGRRARTRAHRSRLRTQIKRLREAVERGDLGQARTLLPSTLALLDRSVGKGVLKRNAAARRKSRLARLVRKQST
jgi:small subunit ribosomal protein S20